MDLGLLCEDTLTLSDEEEDDDALRDATIQNENGYKHDNRCLTSADLLGAGLYRQGLMDGYGTSRMNTVLVGDDVLTKTSTDTSSGLCYECKSTLLHSSILCFNRPQARSIEAKREANFSTSAVHSKVYLKACRQLLQAETIKGSRHHHHESSDTQSCENTTMTNDINTNGGSNSGSSSNISNQSNQCKQRLCYPKFAPQCVAAMVPIK